MEKASIILIVAGLAAVILAAASPFVRTHAADPFHHDFGEVLSGSVVTHDFELTNPGPGAWKIGDVQRSCSCTTTIEPGVEVAPGERLVVPMEVSLAGKEGPFSSIVSFSVGEGAPLSFSVSGTAINALPDMLEFDRIDPLDPHARSIRFRSPDEELLSIQGLSVTPSAVATATISGPDPTGWYEVVVQPTVPVSPGPLEAWVTFETGHSEVPKHTFKVVGHAPLPVELDKSRVYLEGLSDGSPVSFEVVLSSTNGEPFEVLGVEEEDLETVPEIPSSTFEAPLRLTGAFKGSSKPGVEVRGCRFLLRSGGVEFRVKFEAAVRWRESQ